MRQYLLSAGLIISFLIYSLHQQLEAANAENKVIPSPLSQNQSYPSLQANKDTFSSPTKYKNGTYTGSSVDVFYGNVQVQAVISGGKITDVIFLDFPQDRRTSREISAQATPILRQEALTSQVAEVDTISGATQTSEGFKTSLKSALSQAQ